MSKEEMIKAILDRVNGWESSEKSNFIEAILDQHICREDLHHIMDMQNIGRTGG